MKSFILSLGKTIGVLLIQLFSGLVYFFVASWTSVFIIWGICGDNSPCYTATPYSVIITIITLTFIGSILPPLISFFLLDIKLKKIEETVVATVGTLVIFFTSFGFVRYSLFFLLMPVAYASCTMLLLKKKKAKKVIAVKS